MKRTLLLWTVLWLVGSCATTQRGWQPGQAAAPRTVELRTGIAYDPRTQEISIPYSVVNTGEKPAAMLPYAVYAVLTDGQGTRFFNCPAFLVYAGRITAHAYTVIPPKGSFESVLRISATNLVSANTTCRTRKQGVPAGKYQVRLEYEDALARHKQSISYLTSALVPVELP